MKDIPKDLTLGLHHERVVPTREGYRSFYCGWNETCSLAILVICADYPDEWGYVSARKPQRDITPYALDDDQLRAELRGDGAIDPSSIQRRFEAAAYEPLLFVGLAMQWLSELGHENPIPEDAVATPQGVSRGPDYFVDDGRGNAVSRSAVTYLDAPASLRYQHSSKRSPFIF
jgi:hypothetical protein